MSYEQLYETGYKWSGKDVLSGASPVIFSKIASEIGSGKRVLDFGCGNGALLEILSKQGNDVVGIEYSRSAAKAASNRKVKVLVAKGRRLPFGNGMFDYVVSTEVIEHLVDTGAFLDECNRVLAKHGKLIITTPNLASISNRIKLLAGVKPTYAEAELEGTSGHLRLFTADMLSALVGKHGFTVIKRLGSRLMVPGTQAFIPHAEKIAPSLTEHIILVCRKKTE